MDEGIQNPQHLPVGDDIAHELSVVGEADDTLAVDDQLGRHAAQLEQPDLLPIPVGYHMVRVWQADEGVPAAPPVVCEALTLVRTDDDDLRAPSNEQRVVVAHLRQVPAAERSSEPAVENQRDGLFALVGG